MERRGSPPLSNFMTNASTAQLTLQRGRCQVNGNNIGNFRFVQNKKKSVVCLQVSHLDPSWISESEAMEGRHKQVNPRRFSPFWCHSCFIGIQIWVPAFKHWMLSHLPSTIYLMPINLVEAGKLIILCIITSVGQIRHLPTINQQSDRAPPPGRHQPSQGILCQILTLMNSFQSFKLK